MPRHYNTARRIDFILKAFPKLRRKLEYIGRKYHEIQENWDYDCDYNGERWLVRTLAAARKLESVFDVGANHGDWTAMVLEENPGAVVHCFEISPATFQKIARRAEAEGWQPPRAFLNAFGLSNENTETKIKYFPDGDSISTLVEVMSAHKYELVGAQVMRGKDYCARQAIPGIDLLKLDVEGAEHLVLEGFEDLIQPATIPVVQFEYGRACILTKYLLKDYYDFFTKRGYRIGKLFPSSVRFRDYQLEDENFLGPNYIAANPQLAGILGAVK